VPQAHGRSGDGAARRTARARLVRRGLLLGALGALFMTVWPADIIHFYGAYFVLSAALLFASGRAIAATLLVTIIGAAAFLGSGAWPARWDLATLEYSGQWTADGFARSLFLDGFHPVLPWFALFLYGLLLGRAPFADSTWLTRAGFAGGALWLALELSGAALAPTGVETPGARALFATSCFPPTPTYVVGAGGLATAVIAASSALVRRAPTGLVQPFEATGRLALTIYLAHVIVGLGALEALGLDDDRGLPFVVAAAAAFCVAAMACATWWLRRFARGPFEALLRCVD